MSLPLLRQDRQRIPSRDLLGLRGIAFVAALALLAGGCAAGGRPATPMRLEVLRGIGKILRGGLTGATEIVSSSAGVEPGDRVAISTNGLARLRLERGRVFELEGAEVTVESGTRVRLLRGNLLGELDEAGAVEAAGAIFSATPARFRVDGGLEIRVGVYRGKVTARRGSEELTVPAYRQVVISGSGLPRAARPLRLPTSGDRWDRRYLQ
ncbi:MAG: hypothetical protein ACRDIF_01745, partial [Actinomycetota bacterium]